MIGLGTYLIRVVPFLIALRLEDREEDAPQDHSRTRGRFSGVLALIGPSVVAALLITSVLPQPDGGEFGAQLTRNLLALIPTLVVAARSKSLGLTVMAGVASYWLVAALL